jgi:hypothetical protein
MAKKPTKRVAKRITTRKPATSGKVRRAARKATGAVQRMARVPKE